MAFALRFVEWCTWIRGARAGTLDEDRQGIDLVVHTDAGDVRVQVKSNVGNAKRFRRQRNLGRYDELIALVIIGDRDESMILDRFFDELVRVREILLARRAP